MEPTGSRLGRRGAGLSRFAHSSSPASARHTRSRGGCPCPTHVSPRMIRGARLSDRRRLCLAGAICTGGTASWDIATHGSVFVALVASIMTLGLCFSAAFPKMIPPFSGEAPANSSWFSKVAFATGFPSSRSLASRSVIGVAGVTLVQRFGLYPSAALAFDVSIAIAVLAIMLLLSFFIARARQ